MECRPNGQKNEWENQKVRDRLEDEKDGEFMRFKDVREYKFKG